MPTLSLADLLEVLSEEIATRYSSHAVVWNLVALLVAGVFLIASCWLLGVLSGKKPTRQLHSEPTKHLHAQLRSANTERERKIKELRERERERERERARAMSDNNKVPKGEPKGDKGPKNPKSSPASQDIHVLTRKGNLAGVPLSRALSLAPHYFSTLYDKRTLTAASPPLSPPHALSLAPHYFSTICNKFTLTLQLLKRNAGLRRLLA